MKKLIYFTALAGCLLGIASCDKVVSSPPLIDLARDGQNGFNLVVDNRTAIMICVPALYADSRYGNLIIRQNGIMISPQVNSEPSRNWETVGPYFVVKPGARVKMFYNMSAYDLKAGGRYQYSLNTSYIKCADLSSDQAGQNSFVELEASGTI